MGSKLLAYLLRHGAVREGLNPSHEDGWVEIEKLTQHPKIARHMDTACFMRLLAEVCQTSMSERTGEPRFTWESSPPESDNLGRVRANYARKYQVSDSVFSNVRPHALGLEEVLMVLKEGGHEE